MQINQRIPTSQFAYIEFTENYDSIEDAMADHKRVLKLFEDNSGLSTNDWAKVRNTMLVTGQCDPNLLEEMNASQRWFVNELKKALRANEVKEPVIN